MNTQKDRWQESWRPVLVVPLDKWQVDERMTVQVQPEPVVGGSFSILERAFNKSGRSPFWKRVIEMKLTSLVAVVAVAGLLTGCDKNADSASQAPEKPVTANDVKQQVKEATSTTADYVGQKKDEFLAATEKQMKELDVKIDELAKKSEGLKDDAKVQSDKAMAELREQRAAAGRKYDELKAASKDTWDKTKDGFASAWAEVEKSYENIKAKYF